VLFKVYLNILYHSRYHIEL